MARKLCAFFSWLSVDGIAWKEVEYSDLILIWQVGLLNGDKASKGAPVSHRYVNALIQEACLFLSWASDRGYRPPFRIPVRLTRSSSKGSGRHSHSHKRPKSVIRAGTLPPRPSQLVLPTPQDVAKWLKQVERLKGPVKSLCCELILTTGMRISEVIQWRTDTLPPKSEWRLIDGKVPVLIKWGVKGGKVSPGSMEGTKQREILVPHELAERIDHYRAWQRPGQIRKWVNSAATSEERSQRLHSAKTDRLWLGDSSNSPFSTNQLYQDWTRVPGCPNGWHPHKGRHYFAVDLLVEHTSELLKSRDMEGCPPMDWLIGTLSSQVRLILMPLLGHVSEETSNIYLRATWARLSLRVSHPSIRWQDFLEDRDDAN